MDNLDRFLTAHASHFPSALSEIRSGKKRTHWMWFIFPQLKGLGHSETAAFYGITDIHQAKAFLDHPTLGKNLREISTALLQHRNRTATEIFGSPDDLKLRSSMTLFDKAGNDKVFGEIIAAFFNGKPDERTLKILSESD